MKDSIQLYKRLLAYVFPHWRVTLLSFLAMALAGACQPIMPMLLQPLIDNFGLSTIRFTLSFTPDWWRHPLLFIAQNIWLIPILIVIVSIVKGLADYVANISSQWVAQKAIQSIREDVFAHQMRLPIAEHLKQTPARMLSRFTYDINQAGSALSNAWLIVIQDSLYILVLTATLLWSAWELTLVIVAIAPIIAWIIRQASGKMRHSSREQQQTMAQLTASIDESLNGLREIKIFGGQDHENRRFARIGQRFRQQTMAMARISAINVPLVQVLASIAIAIVIGVAMGLSASRAFSSGQFIAYITTMALLFEPIRRLTNVNATIQRGLAGAQSIFELLDTPVEPDHGRAQPHTNPTQGALRLEDISFRYPGQEGWALEDFNLDIRAGETLALVGASGSGKTTLFGLLARFFEAEKGRIWLDDQTIDTLQLRALRQQIALVGQHPALFDDSVRANIAYGRPDASTAELEDAARQAHALDFIQQLPEGFETRIGPNGSALSGGQRQRLALARAFLKNAPILLLDEATSALDNESERLVRDALQTLRKNRTVLIIAHRLSTIRDADRIAVMAHGRLIELGDHETLLARQGSYARLLASGESALQTASE